MYVILCIAIVLPKYWTNLNFDGSKWEVRRSPQWLQFILRMIMMIIEIHPIVVEIYFSLQTLTLPSPLLLFFFFFTILNVLFPGAGSKHRGEGGGFLRANTAIRLQWDSNLLPPCSLLHLPKPTDSSSTPPQDRCRLNHWWTKGQKTRTHELRMEKPQLSAFATLTDKNVPDHSYHSGTCYLCHMSVQGFLWDPNVITVLSSSTKSHVILQASRKLKNKQLSQ